MPPDKDEIARLTEEYGGAWGIHHTRRLLKLVAILGEGRDYDAEAVWLAAQLHDWGAHSTWAKNGVDHAGPTRREVAGDFRRARGAPEATVGLVVECIRTHHSGDPGRSREAVLLSDAGGLDFLGAIGVMRDFSKSPREMRRGLDAARKSRQEVRGRLCLDRSNEIAAARLREMDEILAAFERSSFGGF